MEVSNSPCALGEIQTMGLFVSQIQPGAQGSGSISSSCSNLEHRVTAPAQRELRGYGCGSSNRRSDWGATLVMSAFAHPPAEDCHVQGALDYAADHFPPPSSAMPLNFWWLASSPGDQIKELWAEYLMPVIYYILHSFLPTSIHC